MKIEKILKFYPEVKDEVNFKSFYLGTNYPEVNFKSFIIFYKVNFKIYLTSISRINFEIKFTNIS